MRGWHMMNKLRNGGGEEKGESGNNAGKLSMGKTMSTTVSPRTGVFGGVSKRSPEAAHVVTHGVQVLPESDAEAQRRIAYEMEVRRNDSKKMAWLLRKKTVERNRL